MDAFDDDQVTQTSPTGCTYVSAGWRCRGGGLLPEGMGQAPLEQPCPACGTQRFLDLAWARATRVNASCACYTCMPKMGLGTAGFKIALAEALRVNPIQSQAWLQSHDACALVN